MSVSNAVRSGLRCNACRFALLNSFTSLCGVPLRVLSESVSPKHSSPGQRRPFSEVRARLSDREEQRFVQYDGPALSAQLEGEEEITPVQDATLEHPISPPATETRPAPDSHVPWYLQVQTPQRAPDHPLAERQRLPGLPSKPPPILQPLLDQISVDLGLDHLSLLDLRALDPPPALGANTIMLIGTARSEKHLHVSADRLCRWLRSTWGLRVYADGLLGRNELKLKMRRKAKRSRLLGAVGAKETSSSPNADDGIRTGWVCVNVGRVDGAQKRLSNNFEQGTEETASEEAEAESEEAVEEQTFVGFGRQTEGVRIVVQMFTEEKRAEVDLESLWGGILRNANNKKNTDKARIEAELATEQDRAELETSTDAKAVTEHSLQHPTVSPFSTGSHVSNSQGAQQVRGLHMAARRLQLQAVQVSQRHSAEMFNPSFYPDSQQQTIWPTSAPSTDPHLERVNYLKSLPRGQALREFETDESKVSQTFPSFPNETQWESLIKLHALGSQLSHPDYGKREVGLLYAATQESGVAIAESTFLAMLRAHLAPSVRGARTPQRRLSPNSIASALGVLDDMHSHGYNIMTEEILLLLHEAAGPASPPAGPGAQLTPTQGKSHEQQTLAQSKMLNLVAHLPAPPSDALVLTLLQRHAAQDDWRTFWAAWALPPQHMRSRTAAMYRLVFDAVASRDKQREALKVLRSCVPDMEREMPPVRLEGEIARAVQKCIDVAMPGMERKQWEKVGGEFGPLWRRCERGKSEKWGVEELLDDM
ncbi:hypothetical protein B0A49_11539 [Cryomyces minteri]|uniref:ATPase synthesis protein 25 n=1 Tax=Cryomyces minteri TaxID=331657 RepID=A0A4U0WNF7_9PEZI|nr:hypothetical protein B0A49_11539 [Cryomyces minteri]